MLYTYKNEKSLLSCPCQRPRLTKKQSAPNYSRQNKPHTQKLRPPQKQADLVIDPSSFPRPATRNKPDERHDNKRFLSGYEKSPSALLCGLKLCRQEAV